jgi:hypothetical protein
MDPAIELLEEYGLVRDEDSLRAIGFSKSKILRLHRKLYALVENRQKKDLAETSVEGEIDPFTFVASKSLRGVSDCGEYFCRLQKLDLLGRYAALYATKVILPLPISDPSKIDDPSDAADEVSQTSLALLRLRPLVDAGVIFPVVMRTFHRCKHESAWAEERIDFIQNLGLKATKIFQNDFRVRFQLPDKSPTGFPSAYIEGPEDFLEHKGVILLLNENHNWGAKSWRYDADGMVEVRGTRKVEFLHHIFGGIADETSFYLEYGKSKNARYLASRSGETFLLDLFTQGDEELSATSAALNAYMDQVLPLPSDLPLARLLRIRREERDSFARYRLAVGRFLTDVAKKKKRVGKREVREGFREQIEPELVKIRQEVNGERRRQVRRIVGGMGAMVASLKLGMFGAVAPLVSGAIGAKLLGEAATKTCEHGSNLKEKNDFYFLLRVIQEAEAHQ